jgi:dihydrofolate reductase
MTGSSGAAPFAAQHDGRRGGRIIFMTSGQDLGPMTGEIAYAASKGALASITRSLADHLADRAITLNTVNPGPLILPRLRGLKMETGRKEARMARLIYSAIMSLDGYTADADGRFEWAAPDEEVFAFVNDLERPVGTYLYGRRMYETMRYWETAHTLAGQSPVGLEFARIWQAADKIVYSTTLEATTTARTRVERDFDPDQVEKLKAGSGSDLTVAGAHLAGQTIAAGLVDEYQLFIVPAVVGGGTRALPDQVRLDLGLAAEHRFGNGVIYLCYRPE